MSNPTTDRAWEMAERYSASGACPCIDHSGECLANAHLAGQEAARAEWTEERRLATILRDEAMKAAGLATYALNKALYDYDQWLAKSGGEK